MKKHVIIFFIISLLFISIFCVVFFYCFLYPVKYKKIIKENCELYNLNKEIVFSIINIESGFKNNVVSNVGAVGLMQIMPKTAQEISKKLNLNYETIDLLNTETNIKFGCYYIRYLLDYYKNNLQYAICAYNAGLANVNNWITKDYNIKNEKLINIPFKETKIYWDKFTKNMKIYSAIIK